MAENGIRQIVVVDGGRVLGVVNERDLFALQRVSMRQVIEGLRGAESSRSSRGPPTTSAASRATCSRKASAAEPLTRTIASLNDASHAPRDRPRAAQPRGRRPRLVLARARQRRPRRADARDRPGQCDRVARPAPAADAARGRLIAFARDVNDALAKLGFPLCQRRRDGAANRDMCLTLDEWKERFLGWLSAPTPQALLSANIVFDFGRSTATRRSPTSCATWLLSATRAEQGVPATPGRRTRCRRRRRSA